MRRKASTSQLPRWAKFANKVIKANLGSLDRPFKLTFVVTKECHSKCLYCQIWKEKPQNELTLDEIRQFAKNSPFLTWVDFMGGEPTDRDDFVELINAFMDNCPDLLFVHFATNGLKSKRIEKFAQQLVELGAPNLTVTVSIDGPPEVNDRVRGITGDFRKAVETYAALSTLGVKTYVGMTLFNENVSLVDQTYAALKAALPDFNYRKLHINIPNVSAHYYGNTETARIPNIEMVATIQRFMKQRGIPRSPFDLVERMYQKRIEKYISTRRCPQDCSSLMASCYLAEKGDLYPCLIWNEPLGNIREHGYSIVPILEKARTRELRQQILQKKCPNCWTPCEAFPTLCSNVLKTVTLRS